MEEAADPLEEGFEGKEIGIEESPHLLLLPQINLLPVFLSDLNTNSKKIGIGDLLIQERIMVPREGDLIFFDLQDAVEDIFPIVVLI